MRIGLDCRLFSESGVGRYTRNLINQLQNLDYKNDYVLFVRRKDREEILNRVQNDNFSIVNADIRWHTLEEQLKFPSIITKENLDLMHFPYFSVPIFYNKPFVVTIHDLILHHFPTGLASTLPHWLYKVKLIGYKFVISKIAKKAKKIITVSNATKSEIIDHLKVEEDKVIVTYEGIDDKIRNSNIEIRNKSKIINTKTSADKYFLYVGNAYPHKNLDRLLEALSLLCHPEASAEGSHGILRSAQNDISLVLVGKEDYFYKRLKGKVKNMNLEKSVKFLGEVSDEELTSLYRNALALVVPSLMEGFGLPALEAMANKCLVLASDIASLREIGSDAAIYFDPYNPKDIAEKMREACFNDLNHFSEKIKRGLERVKMFSWEKMTRETLRVYESCVGRQPKHQVSQ
jgi:glycosyltransferase involved in cell wall biosynthesis